MGENTKQPELTLKIGSGKERPSTTPLFDLLIRNLPTNEKEFEKNRDLRVIFSFFARDYLIEKIKKIFDELPKKIHPPAEINETEIRRAGRKRAEINRIKESIESHLIAIASADQGVIGFGKRRAKIISDKRLRAIDALESFLGEIEERFYLQP